MQHALLYLAERMAALDKRMKVFVRHQIEQIFFDIEFGSGMFPHGFHGPQSQNDQQMFQQHEFARRMKSTPGFTNQWPWPYGAMALWRYGPIVLSTSLEGNHELDDVFH